MFFKSCLSRRGRKSLILTMPWMRRYICDEGRAVPVLIRICSRFVKKGRRLDANKRSGYAMTFEEMARGDRATLCATIRRGRPGRVPAGFRGVAGVSVADGSRRWGALVGIGALMGVSGISFWPVGSPARWARRWATGSPTGSALRFKDGSRACGPCRAIRICCRARNASSAVGCAEHFHRPLFRTAARIRAACGRHFRDAVLAVSVRQFHLGVPMGGGHALRPARSA